MSNIDELKKLVRILRSENGCPWDRAQTHSSLKPQCLEEATEVIAGINIYERTREFENLKEELGDILFQVMLHSVIAEEENLFSFDDVVENVIKKMIRRHPHVFNGEKYVSDEEQRKGWENIKLSEKKGNEWQTEYLKDAINEIEILIKEAKERKGFS